MVKPAELTAPRSRGGLAVHPVLLLAPLLAIALAMRLVNLDSYTGKFDEGIRAEQLLLMSAGFRPVRDIFAAQGPLSLDIFYPPYLVFGQTLAAARVAVVLFALVGLTAVFWVADLLGGRVAALLSVLLLVVSPLYLKNSRLALVEIPALVPATVSLGAMLLFQRSGRHGWLVLSAVCFAIALLIKPMIVAVAVPLGLALLLRARRSPLDFLVFGLIAASVGAVVVALYGPEQVWHQVVSYRASARQASDWTLRGNGRIVLAELPDEGLPLYAIAALSSLSLAVTRPRWGIPLVAWLATSVALLLLYSPLQFKHAVILLPPIALVVGATGAGLLESAFRLLSSGPRRPGEERRPSNQKIETLRALLTAALLLWYLSSLPAVARQDWAVMSASTETRVEAYAEESEVLGTLTGPRDFVLVDDPIVAFNSRRLVPPSLVDPSSYRVRSGALGGSEVVEAVERYDVKLLLLFSDGLRDLKKFDTYVDERYRAVRIVERQNSKDRALYLRDDGDFASARAVLARGIEHPLTVDFGGEMRLLGWSLARDDLRAGSSTSLTLHWEALRPTAVDYHVLTRLQPAGGRADIQTQRSLGGGGEGTSQWEAGRWVFRTQTLTAPPRAAAGDYDLLVALYDSKRSISPPLTAGGEPNATELLLGRMRVR